MLLAREGCTKDLVDEVFGLCNLLALPNSFRKFELLLEYYLFCSFFIFCSFYSFNCSAFLASICLFLSMKFLEEEFPWAEGGRGMFDTEADFGPIIYISSSF